MLRQQLDDLNTAFNRLYHEVCRLQDPALTMSTIVVIERMKRVLLTLEMDRNDPILDPVTEIINSDD